MKCAQIYISIYIMQIHKIQIRIYTWIFVAVRLVTYLRYIPSQTLVVIRPTRGQRSRTDLSRQAENRLFTSIPTHVTMDPCNFIISCHSHSSKYSDTECHGLYINSTTIQNTITTLSLWTPPNQFVMAQFLLSIPNAVYEQRWAAYRKVSQCFFTLFSVSLCQLCLARDTQWL